MGIQSKDFATKEGFTYNYWNVSNFKLSKDTGDVEFSFAAYKDRASYLAGKSSIETRLHSYKLDKEDANVKPYSILEIEYTNSVEKKFRIEASKSIDLAQELNLELTSLLNQIIQWCYYTIKQLDIFKDAENN